MDLFRSTPNVFYPLFFLFDLVFDDDDDVVGKISVVEVNLVATVKRKIKYLTPKQDFLTIYGTLYLYARNLQRLLNCCYIVLLCISSFHKSTAFVAIGTMRFGFSSSTPDSY